jgi:hypothetical protein
MKRLFGLSFTLIVGLAATHIFAGCGSEDDTITPGTDDASTSDGGGGGQADAFIDTILDGASRADAPECKPAGQECASSTDCCSANCDTTTKKCVTPLPTSTCKLAGAACGNSTECCSTSCIGGTCASKQCVADNGACAQGAECCGGTCAPNGTGGGACKPLSTTCKTAGNPCGAAGDCCSKLCNNGVCSSDVGFCTQKTELCANNADCCGGNCVKASGAALGTCGDSVTAPGTGNCEVKGTVCATTGQTVPNCGGSCCTKICATSGAASGFLVCQPAGGCAPTGEICRADSDCCGWSGSPAYTNYPPGSNTNTVTCAKSSPGQEFGRCDLGNVCSQAGVICKPNDQACSAANVCCRPNGEGVTANYCNSTPENCCKKDALGIPRCLLNKIDCASPPAAGSSCVTSADCCGNPCINNSCLATCVQVNQTCTSHADCCAGVQCVIATGAKAGLCGGTLSTDGTTVNPTTGGGPGPAPTSCSLYGQTCTQTSECCDGVPCTSGRCRYP